MVEPLHLPWHSELAVVGGALRDVLVSSGKGTPGYKLECNVIGIHIKDECTATLSMGTTNSVSGVTAMFNPSEKLSCTQGGSGSGSLEGSQSIQASNGGKLSTEMEEPPTWLAGGKPIVSAAAIGWKGTITLSDSISSIGTVAVKCEDTGSGFVGAGTLVK